MKAKTYGFMEDGNFKTVSLLAQTIESFSSGRKISGDIVEIVGDELNKEYFSAHEISKGKIALNFEKAKQIKIGQLRIGRNKKLKELDVDFMISLETGDEDKKDKVAGLKQKLRDFQNEPNFVKISSVEELEAYKPF